jgi:hypothetical protein
LNLQLEKDGNIEIAGDCQIEFGYKQSLVFEPFQVDKKIMALDLWRVVGLHQGSMLQFLALFPTLCEQTALFSNINLMINFRHKIPVFWVKVKKIVTLTRRKKVYYPYPGIQLPALVS